MRARIPFPAWLTLHILTVLGLWAILVFLMLGSLTGTSTIDTIDIRFDVNCGVEPVDQQRSCTMAYSYGGKRYSFNENASPIIPLSDLHENPWEALIELPSKFFDRRICAELSGKNAGASTVRLQLDAEHPDISSMAINGRVCSLIVDDGERRFNISSPQLSDIEFDPQFHSAAIDVLQRAILDPSVTTIPAEDLDLRVTLTSELVQAGAIKVIHAVAFVLALHIIVLLYELYSVAKASWLRRQKSA